MFCFLFHSLQWDDDWIFSLCFCRTDSLMKCEPSDFGLKDQTLTASNHKTIKQTQSISQWNHHQFFFSLSDTDTQVHLWHRYLFILTVTSVKGSKPSCCHHGCSVCSSRFRLLTHQWNLLFSIWTKVYCSHHRQCFVHTNRSESYVSLCFNSEDSMRRNWLSGTIKLWISFMVITAAPSLDLMYWIFMFMLCSRLTANPTT